MTVGTLVRVKTKVYREGEIGVIVREWPPDFSHPDKTYSVLFWNETIDRIAGICIEEIK